MRPIDTDALELVAPALGVGNPATATRPVDFDDENLQQVLDVGRLIRRCRSLAGGIFFSRAEFVALGADQRLDSFDPYDFSSAAGATIGPQYQRPVNPELDVWILGMDVRESVAGAVDGVLVGLQVPATLMAMSNNGQGIVGMFRSYAHFSGSIVQQGVDNLIPETTSGLVSVDRAVRIPRGATIDFYVDFNAAATCQVKVTTGVFARGLGQDALGAG